MIARVLVTGGSGMLGQAILRAAQLLKPHWEISAPSRHELDLLNQKQTHQYCHDIPFDIVIHTAAKVGGIQANMNDHYGFLSENLIMNATIIDSARKAGIKNLINFGSSCMYPRNCAHALQEDDILSAALEPTNEGYAIAKIAAAKLCVYSSHQFGLSYRTFIPCNLYGPHDTYDPLNGHVLAAALLKIHTAKIMGNNTVEIWGDGTVRREFLFIDDLARFTIERSENLDNLPPILNTGAGYDITINDLYSAIAQTIGYTGSFVHNLDHPMGMTKKLMTSARAQEYGWNPQTPLSKGLQHTYTAFLNEFKDSFPTQAQNAQ